MAFDVIVVGGSFAGLAAALYVARTRRSVCVVDMGLPRNRFAARSHGLLGQDGDSPGQMLATARAQISAYSGATFVSGAVVRAAAEGNGFGAGLAGGEQLEASRLVLAYGISDVLPELPGLAEHWGKSVLHCPYCHGYEFGGQRLGLLNVSSMSTHQAMMIAEWGPTTFFLNGAETPDAAVLEDLERRGIAIEPAVVAAVVGDGERISAVELAGGERIALDALYLGPPTRLNSDLAEQLGCEVIDGPFGKIVRTDGAKMTTVPGVFAAGDITRAAHNVTWACSDGVTAGMSAHRSLVF